MNISKMKAHFCVLFCTSSVALFLLLSTFKLLEAKTFNLKQPPLAESKNLSQAFLDCAARCSNSSSCVGVTIFKYIEQKFSPVQNPYYCRTDLSETTLTPPESDNNENATVIYKFSVRNKLRKVVRRPVVVLGRTERQAQFTAHSILNELNRIQNRTNGHVLDLEDFGLPQDSHAHNQNPLSSSADSISNILNSEPADDDVDSRTQLKEFPSVSQNNQDLHDNQSLQANNGVKNFTDENLSAALSNANPSELATSTVSEPIIDNPTEAQLPHGAADQQHVIGGNVTNNSIVDLLDVRNNIDSHQQNSLTITDTSGTPIIQSNSFVKLPPGGSATLVETTHPGVMEGTDENSNSSSEGNPIQTSTSTINSNPPSPLLPKVGTTLSPLMSAFSLASELPISPPAETPIEPPDSHLAIAAENSSLSNLDGEPGMTSQSGIANTETGLGESAPAIGSESQVNAGENAHIPDISDQIGPVPQATLSPPSFSLVALEPHQHLPMLPSEMQPMENPSNLPEGRTPILPTINTSNELEEAKTTPVALTSDVASIPHDSSNLSETNFMSSLPDSLSSTTDNNSIPPQNSLETPIHSGTEIGPLSSITGAKEESPTVQNVNETPDLSKAITEPTSISSIPVNPEPMPPNSPGTLAQTGIPTESSAELNFGTAIPNSADATPVQTMPAEIPLLSSAPILPNADGTLSNAPESLVSATVSSPIKAETVAPNMSDTEVIVPAVQTEVSPTSPTETNSGTALSNFQNTEVPMSITKAETTIPSSITQEVSSSAEPILQSVPNAPIPSEIPAETIPTSSNSSMDSNPQTISQNVPDTLTPSAIPTEIIPMPSAELSAQTDLQDVPETPTPSTIPTENLPATSIGSNLQTTQQSAPESPIPSAIPTEIMNSNAQISSQNVPETPIPSAIPTESIPVSATDSRTQPTPQSALETTVIPSATQAESIPAPSTDSNTQIVSQNVAETSLPSVVSTVPVTSADSSVQPTLQSAPETQSSLLTPTENTPISSTELNALQSTPGTPISSAIPAEIIPTSETDLSFPTTLQSVTKTPIPSSLPAQIITDLNVQATLQSPTTAPGPGQAPAENPETLSTPFSAVTILQNTTEIQNLPTMLAESTLLTTSEPSQISEITQSSSESPIVPTSQTEIQNIPVPAINPSGDAIVQNLTVMSSTTETIVITLPANLSGDTALETPKFTPTPIQDAPKDATISTVDPSLISDNNPGVSSESAEGNVSSQSPGFDRVSNEMPSSILPETDPLAPTGKTESTVSPITEDHESTGFLLTTTSVPALTAMLTPTTQTPDESNAIITESQSDSTLNSPTTPIDAQNEVINIHEDTTLFEHTNSSISQEEAKPVTIIAPGIIIRPTPNTTVPHEVIQNVVTILPGVETTASQAVIISESDVIEKGSTKSEFVEVITTDEECIFEDRERFRRNILAGTYAIMDDEPVLLTFVEGASCIATFSKNGHHGFFSIKTVLPGFPLTHQVNAAAYMNDRLFVLDSSPEQSVYNFKYSSELQIYEQLEPNVIDRQDFLKQHCGVELPHTIAVKALFTTQHTDNSNFSCIIFDMSRNPIISLEANKEIVSLAKAINFLLETEFVEYAEAVFAWEEHPTRIVYVFGSNGELYALRRNFFEGLEWKLGNYEVIPYELFPV